MNYSRRLDKVKQFIKTNGCDAFLVEDSVNLYYLTGISLSVGKMLVTDAEAFLLVDNRYFEFCKNKAPV